MKYLKKNHPQVVIITNDFGVGYEDNIDLDAYKLWVETLIIKATEFNSWVLLISTDQVFDGKEISYKPSSQKNPSTKIGKFYSEIEDFLINKCPSAGVLRIAGYIYGKIQKADNKSLLGKLAHNHTKIELDNTIAIPLTYADDIAIICSQLIERKQKHCNFMGIWHWYSGESFTEYQLGNEIANALNYPHENLSIKQDNTYRAVNLDSTALRVMGLGRVSKFQTVLPHILSDIKS